MEKMLYRITSLEGFLYLVVNTNERFVNPIDCWEDTYEGFMLHRLDTEQGKREILNILYNNLSKNDVNLTIRNYTKLTRARYTCYGQCWSKVKDSDAMWRIYSYGNKSVQLVSDKDRITSSLNLNDDSISIRLSDIKYDVDDTNDISSKIIYNRSKVNEPYFHKRSAFKHEEEVRVIITLKDRLKEFTSFSEQALINNYKKVVDENDSIDRILKAEQLTGKYKDLYESAFPKELVVGIGHINKYLIGIRVHPLADEWYVNLIKEICGRNNINFLGKSDLYRSIV